MFHLKRAGGQCFTNISCYNNHYCHLLPFHFGDILLGQTTMEFSCASASLFLDIFYFFSFFRKKSIFVIQDNPLTIVHDWAHCQPCIMGITTWRCVYSGVVYHLTDSRSGCVKLKHSMCTELSISITYCSIIIKGSNHVHVLILSIPHSILWYFSTAYTDRYELSKNM